MNPVCQQNLLFQKNLNNTEIHTYSTRLISELTCSVDQMAADWLGLLVRKLYALSQKIIYLQIKRMLTCNDV